MVEIQKIKNAESVTRLACVDCPERRQCGECKEYQSENDFRLNEWIKAGKLTTQGKCKKCMTRNRESKVCSGPCGFELPQSAFTSRMWLLTHKCKSCMRTNAASRECAGP